MPTYEFLCKGCGKKFTLVLSLSEYEKKNTHCPSCGAIQVEQQVHSVYTKTSKKS